MTEGPEFEPGESFAPEEADERIAALLAMPHEQALTTGDPTGRLVLALAVVHAPPAGAEAALARVWSRLAEDAPSTPAATAPTPTQAESAPVETTVVHERPSTQTPRLAPRRSDASRRATALASAARALAAVLVVALLGGSFYALLNRHTAAPTTAGSPDWQEVGISSARVSGMDAFTSSGGVAYAVSDTSVTIYACANSHLWISTNGGETYAPFAPGLAALYTTLRADSATWHVECLPATVPGLPHVFMALVQNGTNQVRIGYALPGGSWRPFTLLAPAPGDPTGAELWQALTSGGPVQNVQALGTTLFALVGTNHGAGRLYTTSDLYTGSTGPTESEPSWQRADRPTSGQAPICLTFADAWDPSRLICAASDGYQTSDGGRHWQALQLRKTFQLPVDTASTTDRFADFLVVGASTRAAYIIPPVANSLLRYPLDGGTMRITKLPPGARIAGVTTTDDVYAATIQVLAGYLHVQVYELATGTSVFAPIGPVGDLPYVGAAPVLEVAPAFPGAPPALYLHPPAPDAAPSATSAGRWPLYRLTLAPRGTLLVRAKSTPAASTPTSAPLPSPTPRPACTSDRPDLANIQPGGLGATLDSLHTRWGDPLTAAAGMANLGRYADTGQPQIAFADELPPSLQVYSLAYLVDSTQRMTLAQAQALTLTLAPSDAIQRGTAEAVTYCSAALLAAFPQDPGQSGSFGGLLPANGFFTVTYALRSDGTVDRIGLTLVA